MPKCCVMSEFFLQTKAQYRPQSIRCGHFGVASILILPMVFRIEKLWVFAHYFMVASSAMTFTWVYLRMFLHVVTADRVTALFTAVIGVTGVAALIYARSELKELRRQAQIQHLMNFARSFANEPIVSYRVAAAEHWFKN